MSDNVSGVLRSFGITVNQQGSLRDPSETTRRTPLFKSVIKSYLQGALHDGTLNKGHRYRISQKGTEWLKELQKLFQSLGIHSWIYKEGKDRDVYVLETVAPFLDFLFDPDELVSDLEKIAYIRGFFDAEGGIPRNTSERFYIQLVQKDKMKIVKLKKMLQELGISCGEIHNPSKRIDPNYWRVYVSSSSHQAFIQTIGSLHPRKYHLFEQRMKI